MFCVIFGVVCVFCAATVGVCGHGSSVSIVTGYGLDGPGIESQDRLCCTVLYCTVLCCTVLYCVVL
jgi:hypothetical protein